MKDSSINIKIANAIKNGDFSAYQDIRYPTIEDGSPMVFRGIDFSGTNFSKFTIGFFEFYDCNLDDTSNFRGQPIKISNCSANYVDLRKTRTTIIAYDTDFTSMLIDERTVLADKYSQSEFHNCKIDEDTFRQLKEQGVKFYQS